MSETVFCISKTSTLALLNAGRTMPLRCCCASHFIVAASHKYIHNRIWCSCGDTHDCCSLHFPFMWNDYFDDIAPGGECNDFLPFLCSNIFVYSVSLCILAGRTYAMHNYQNINRDESHFERFSANSSARRNEA